MDLTTKQRKIWEFIQEYARAHGYPPTYKEIQLRFKLRSIGTIQDHLAALARKGFIQHLPGTARGLVLLKKAPGPEEVPLLGRIRAGTPAVSHENFEGTLTFDDLAGKGAARFALKVSGDSMTNAGISDGDFVIVRKQAHAADGDIVVALIDGQTTVKRFRRRGEQLILKPENDTMPELVFAAGKPSLEILGKVVGLLRKY